MKHNNQKLTATIKNRFARICARSHTTMLEIQQKLREDSGNFVMDHAVVFVIIIVVGGVALVLLKNYLQSDLSNSLKDKINQMFN